MTPSPDIVAPGHRDLFDFEMFRCHCGFMIIQQCLLRGQNTRHHKDKHYLRVLVITAGYSLSAAR